MALASCNEARSVTELSLSPLYHYQFSSIARSIKSLAADEAARRALEQEIVAQCLPYAPGVHLLQTDTTALCKPHSPTLAQRTYVHTADNTVAGNRPISVGYTISSINLSTSRWSLPLSFRRVKIDQTANECALEQLGDLMPHFGDDLLVNTLDSNYGNAAYLASAYQYANLVSIVRMKSGMKVFRQPAYKEKRVGCPTIYGARYYLLLNDRHKTYTHP
ncbi:MAG: transposase, partial [Rhodothermales bacterium]